MLGTTSVLRGLCLQSLCLRGLRLRGLPCEVYACEVFSIVLVLCEVFKRSLYFVVLMLCGAYAYEVYAYEVYTWRHICPARSALRGLRLRGFSFGVCTPWRLRLVALTPYEACPARSTLYGAYVLRGLRLQLVVSNPH